MFEVEIDGAWYLNKIVDEMGKEVLASRFNHSKPFDLARTLTVLPSVVGTPVDYRWTTFGVPIVSSAFAHVVENFDPKAIQRIPVTVAPLTIGYKILNILTMLNGLDHERTIIEQYTERDHVPTVIGRIKSMRNLTIKSEIAEGHHIFRLAERWTVIVVSETLKRALERENFTGTKFVPIEKT